MQKPQPFISLAQRFTTACARPAGPNHTTRPAESMCLTNFTATGLPKRSKRAAMVISWLFSRVTA